MAEAFKVQRQRGITFIGLVFLMVVLAMTGAVVVQAVPTVAEYLAVQKAVQKATEGGTPAEVRLLFAKAASIDDIKSITPDQLEISKNGDKVVVGFSYQREIHLMGPAYLTLKYQGQSK